MSLASVAKFTDDAAGLEKTLRLFQGFCTIALGLVQGAAELEAFTTARSQFALGRRYFRLLKWYPCWTVAFAATGRSEKRNLETVLDVGKWSFLGMYFFLEMFTLTNALGVTSYSWGPILQREANKCWFYALAISILRCFYLWVFPEPISATTATANGSAKGKESTVEEKVHTEVKPNPKGDPQLFTQLVIDSCDLFIPGSAVGWIPAGPVLVGTLSTISTTLAGRQIWNRMQHKAQQA